MDNKPEQHFSAGGISCAIWKNTQNKNGQQFDAHNVTFEKRYKDKTGTWKSTNSLTASDIPKLMVVLSKAYEYITVKKESL
ncbi:MAG: hypothetical protein AABX52_02000 [Nanoarchaeota archaeon]